METRCWYRKGLVFPLVLWLLLSTAQTWCADQTPQGSTTAGQEQTVIGQHADRPAIPENEREELRRLREELRHIKRELALLNQNLERPGVREIGAGIGYIFGLCGVAALVAAHRNKGDTRGKGD